MECEEAGGNEQSERENQQDADEFREHTRTPKPASRPGRSRAWTGSKTT